MRIQEVWSTACEHLGVGWAAHFLTENERMERLGRECAQIEDWWVATGDHRAAFENPALSSSELCLIYRRCRRRIPKGWVWALFSSSACDTMDQTWMGEPIDLLCSPVGDG